jgi:predicted nucleic acid-binding protein
MSQFVIDANILFSSLISGKSVYVEVFSAQEFYSVDFAFVELNKYASTVLTKAKLPPERLKEFSSRLFSTVRFIPLFLISDALIQQATALTKAVDIKDAPYLALAMHLNVPLLTRDKPLYEHLLSNGCKVMLWEDFLNNYFKP